jgi:penicillin amidase
MGMVFGAKRSVAEIEKDDDSRRQINSYTAGVNSYIEQLTTSELPLEYKLLNYVPEKWSTLKTALLLKYLSFDLTGGESDIEYTNAKAFFSEEDFNKLYPLIHDSSYPIIPKGTVFPPPSVKPMIPNTADSIYFQWKQPVNVHTLKRDKDNGSNNWVAGGSKTRSGRPILCNDPHLGLNLPSLWYEVQIVTPEYSVYGASLPGSPAVVIGFNDSIAWGETNASRDVLDYYRITFRDGSKSEYLYNNEWKKTEFNVETYLLKDGSRFYDTVAYTEFGPVMFDDHYNGKGRTGSDVNLAVRWKAHDPSNEFKTFNLLNRSKNYDDYENAIKYFLCPGQNFAFASKSGDIAIWHQGQFPAKWYQQGTFVMPGTDSSYKWQADIPPQENPHLKNPERAYVSSANQIPADTIYPYYLGGNYDVFRGLMINRRLSQMTGITPQDMQMLQNENYNAFAETSVPFLLSHTREYELNNEEKKYFGIIRSWNLRNDKDEYGPTVFTTWFETLEQMVWNDELSQQPGPSQKPDAITLIEALKKDSAFSFIDNITTPEKETLEDIVTGSFKKAATTLVFAEKDGRLAWSKFKDAGIRHLLRMEAFSRFHLNTGGGRHVINATQQYKGPSWKMIVHLTDNTEAYGIYPGGQTGNPGSKFYDEFVNDWAEGKYYQLWDMKKEESGDKRIKYVMKFSPSGSRL